MDISSEAEEGVVNGCVKELSEVPTISVLVSKSATYGVVVCPTLASMVTSEFASALYENVYEAEGESCKPGVPTGAGQPRVEATSPPPLSVTQPLPPSTASVPGPEVIAHSVVPWGKLPAVIRFVGPASVAAPASIPCESGRSELDDASEDNASGSESGALSLTLASTPASREPTPPPPPPSAKHTHAS